MLYERVGAYWKSRDSGLVLPLETLVCEQYEHLIAPFQKVQQKKRPNRWGDISGACADKMYGAVSPMIFLYKLAFANFFTEYSETAYLFL